MAPGSGQWAQHDNGGEVMVCPTLLYIFETLYGEREVQNRVIWERLLLNNHYLLQPATRRFWSTMGSTGPWRSPCFFSTLPTLEAAATRVDRYMAFLAAACTGLGLEGAGDFVLGSE